LRPSLKILTSEAGGGTANGSTSWEKRKKKGERNEALDPLIVGGLEKGMGKKKGKCSPQEKRHDEAGQERDLIDFRGRARLSKGRILLGMQVR